MGEDLPVSPARLAMQGTPHTPTLQRKLAGKPRVGGIWTVRLGCDWPVWVAPSVTGCAPVESAGRQRAFAAAGHVWVP